MVIFLSHLYPVNFIFIVLFYDMLCLVFVLSLIKLDLITIIICVKPTHTQTRTGLHAMKYTKDVIKI